MDGGDLYNKLDTKFGNNWHEILDWLEQEAQRYSSIVNESVMDKSTKELLEMIRRGEFSTDKEESDLIGELESRLTKVLGDEYEWKYGTTDLESVFAKIDGGSDYAWRDFVDWLSGEVDRYQMIVNESKMVVNESRNPHKGDIIIIEDDIEVKVVHSFTSAKSAAAYERKIHLTDTDGYSVTEMIASGEIDPNEKGIYVYALYDDKIRLFDFTDGDVEWEIKEN